MAKPVAVITSDVSTVIPVTSAPYPVHLDGTASTATGPATIASYQWYLDVPPESAAVLSSATSATPSFVMDVPGLYQARLVVTDSNGVESEGFTVHIDPATSPYKFTAPSSAYHAVRMSQALTETIPPTSGAKNVAADERELFFVVEELYGLVQGLASATGAYARYVTMAPGSAAADGSAGLPFNPQSAAANGYDGPVQQAVAALAALGTDNGDVPRTVVLQGGSYNEDVTITAYGPWRLAPVGRVTFDGANTFTYVAAATATTAPWFYVQGDGPDTGLLTFASVVLTGNYASPWNLLWDHVSVSGAGGLAQSAAFAATAYAFWTDVAVIQAATIADVVLYTTERCEFYDTLTTKGLGRAQHPVFKGDVTVTDATDDGIYGASFSGTHTWTGSAESAKFDATTLTKFWEAGWAFAGGAHTNDALPPVWSRRQRGLPLQVTDTGVATTPFVSSLYMDVGVPEGSHARLRAWVGLYLQDATQSCRLQLTVGPVGGTAVVVATHSSVLTGPFTGVVRLETEVQVTNADATGSISWHYTVKGGEVGNPLIVDDEDIGVATGTVDLDPAVLRCNAQVEATAGWSGGKSFAILRHMQLDYAGV